MSMVLSLTIKATSTEVRDLELVMLKKSLRYPLLTNNNKKFYQFESLGCRAEMGRDNCQIVTISVEKMVEW